ncbi:HD-GYP domain-containing protein [Actinomadura parmotrematis]|uniref:HD domain-containing protein n=1 Tax=Actinomadura parmotrematis TaxID=2864039 RepID=A0ABS7G3M8_9ACTN|nr:HD domain-containing phosphohydrolase [Actinomadura parmotrematis]MBW8486263.1 HD domain-containing protein [Actinomadura parmotrematis]
MTVRTAARERQRWQTVDSGYLLLVALAGLGVLVAVTQVAVVGVAQPDVALVFGVLIALGELFRMVMPGNREVAPVASAGALGYALLVGVGPERSGQAASLDVVPAVHSTFQVVAITAAGMIVGSLPHVLVGRTPRLDAMARRLITVAVVATCFRPLLALDPKWPVLIVLMGLVVVGSCFTDVLIAALIRAEAVRARLGIAIRDEIGAKMALCAATSATAMLIAVATTVMGPAALLVFTVPILVSQFAFRRYAGIRATYLQTVRALSRVTEVGGYVETGHSRRVSRLSVAMGRELGMSEEELLELEYAALMHDIGQLSLGDPIPGGATVLASPAEQRRIAELGAEVIRQTGVLDRVAHIVRQSSHPYRTGHAAAAGAGSAVAPPLPPPLASRIIKVANAYDDLVGDSADRDRGAAVLERLRLDSAAEYDPAVVEALGRVVDRRPRL